MLVGDLLLVSAPAVVNMAILYSAIGLFHVICRRQFLISFHPDAAEAEGFNIRFWDTLFYMSFGLVIVKSVAIVGVLLVFSYLVVPAVIAQMWCAPGEGRVAGRLVGGDPGEHFGHCVVVLLGLPDRPGSRANAHCYPLGFCCRILPVACARQKPRCGQCRRRRPVHSAFCFGTLTFPKKCPGNRREARSC